MINITDFAQDYLTSEIRRGKTVHPRWFKCPVKDSPEMQAVLRCDPNNPIIGLAVMGTWEQIQRWSMRHHKRNGYFVMKSGLAMDITQIAYAIGMVGQEDFLCKSIEVLMGVGWLSSFDASTTEVLPSISEEVDKTALPTPKSLLPKKANESVLLYAKEKVRELSKNKKCPNAVENPSVVEQALHDAAESGRDIDAIVDAMAIYYSLEIGKNQYRTRPYNFITNRKDEEPSDSWYTPSEAQAYNNKLCRTMGNACGGGEDEKKSSRLWYCSQYENKKPSEMLEIFNEWKSNKEKEEAGYEI